MYSEQCRKNKLLIKNCEQLRLKYNNLEQRFERLRLKSLENIENRKKCGRKRKRKSWERVKCERTKRQCFNEYANKMFQAIPQKSPFCKRAQLCLNMSDKIVNFNWTSQDLKRDAQTLEIVNFSEKSDHSYATPKLIRSIESNDDFENIDYHKIFDSERNWQKEHKRLIINIMDTYRISHEAYHELRQAGKGHFPPLHQIRKERH